MDAFAGAGVDPLLSHVAAAVLGVIFITGAAAKLRDLELFRDALANYRLLSPAGERIVAWCLPCIELGAGLLVLPIATRGIGAAAGLAVLVAVTIAVAINLRRGRTEVECGCGAGEGTTLSWGLVARNVVLGVLALIAAAPVAARPVVWLDRLGLGFASLFLLGLYLCANQLLRNQPRLERLRGLP
jgi:drug/metabolite transporter (DMT)-like permease